MKVKLPINKEVTKFECILDDKIFAMSIYKTSSKAYSFLSKIFASPVESTLHFLLKNISFKPGINTHIENIITYQDQILVSTSNYFDN